MKKTGKRNITQFADRIAKEGIVVLDNITDLPTTGDNIISNNYVICICHKGVVCAEYNMRPVQHGPHDVAIVYPHHVVMTKSISSDYKATFVVVAEDTFQDLSAHITFRNRFRYEQNPSFHLNDSQFADIVSIINAMHTVGNSTIPSRNLLMVSLLDVLFEMTDHFRHFSVVEEDIDSQRISARFYETVIEHHRSHHDVSFYAEQLCLSPKYFSEVIKRETGHSAKYWIAAYLIIAAKMLLRSRSDLNIQQISDLLGYEDQTSFCRHFKKAVGMSPSQFRHQNE